MRRTVQKPLPTIAPVTYHHLSIERARTGAIMLIMMLLPYDPKHDKFYTSAAWHKRFVSEGCIIYATCDERTCPLSNETIVPMLADWKAGKWNMISTKKRTAPK